ncbi:MAG: hypothetical protein A2X56_10900 [Nitrospirae bacterium GWC2_57_13]|jgi:NAD(P)H dehydrogenase (quinone)|nr:MAG: hypothetical protein A2072_00760 [Nitrospirae bacterium GWC1_57_7]OGW30037.1 MAG: hypothetical protein A2X56_10900 [Nitrospirae bacterium GWC2_57_13]OGW41924.1 MAG: hypothetical protein A2X57_09815 [Nitrospirae bacterium GWD2_57_8]HAR45929.1 hypothetical protein [Nitrospiraceae bacterium]HAS54993.1 hypothetical protein [Nitrospiraceae bacterium]
MKILLINGHPCKESFCYALAQAYKQGAQSAGAKIREVHVDDQEFNPNLTHGIVPINSEMAKIRLTAA